MDIIDLHVEVDVTPIALGQEVWIQRTGGQDSGTAAERAGDGQMEIFRFQIVVRGIGLELETKLVNRGQGFAGGVGDGRFELERGHGAGLQTKIGTMTDDQGPRP